MTTEPRAVTRYETSDGKLHQTMELARHHEASLDEMNEANEMLRDGHSVGTILDRFGGAVPDDILYRVTKDSRLSIPHWQCHDAPGYRPTRFLRGLGSLWVFGDVGSWSGPYGGEVRLAYLVRYAKNDRSALDSDAGAEGRTE